MYDLNSTLSINHFSHCNYLPDAIINIYLHFEYHEFNTKGWDLYKKVKIVGLGICQRAFLNYGMHIWSSLNPENKHSTAFHRLRQMLNKLFFSRNYSTMYNGIAVCMLTYVHIGNSYQYLTYAYAYKYSCICISM